MTRENPPASKGPSVRKARPEANAGTEASVPQSLLNYAVGTSPIPLQISTDGTITIVANNPGGYSDQPAQDYVAVATIVFDFGQTGAGAPYLTETNGSSWAVTSPADWDAPQVEGLRFTFQPPSNAAKVFANTGLTFKFGGIPIDATVGSVLLTISETSSTPGDPAQPDLYPPIPTQLGVSTALLGKFPVDFALSPPVATPPNVDAGESSTISWSGAPGAEYVLSFGKQTIRVHANGTKLGADDHYPNQSQGDVPLILEAETTFTLTVTYTPPGGNDSAILQSQRTVGVNYPNPSVVSFSVTPHFLPKLDGGSGTVLLNWATVNGAAPSPVSFFVDPPLSDEEVKLNLDNDLFNTSHLATGEAGFTFTQGHRITLQVVGLSGTTPATQTIRVLGCVAKATVTALPGGIGFTRDGKHLLVASAPILGGWSVFDVGLGSPETWPVSRLAADHTHSGVATTPDGKYALSVSAIVTVRSGPAIAVVEIVPGQPGAAWPQTYLPLALPFDIVPGGDIAVTPDGKYALATMPQGTVVITIPPGAPPSNWTSTLMPGTGQIGVFPAAQMTGSGQIAISPDGKYAFIVSLWMTRVMTIDSTKTPDQWVTTVLPQTGNDVAITADSQYAIIANATQNSVTAITLASGASPTNWTVTPVALTMNAPVRIALSPDGTVAFVAPVKGPVGIIELSEAPGGWTGTTFSQVQTDWPMSIVSPDGRYLLVTNGRDSLLAFQLTPAVSAPASGVATTPALCTAVSAPAVNDDVPPLLAYELSTTPIPLQVSAPGIITIVASNPGTYSDQPAQDYVAVSSLVLDFGLKGSDAGDLTSVDGSSLTVTPPRGWAAPIVDGLRFTFTPPVAGGNIFPQDGLMFVFANIPVNPVVGTVTLTITEIASSPGNPAEPDLYPPQPKQSRQQTKGIGKFPTNFTVGDLVARPPNVPVGGGPTLSWSGTEGAAYELDFGTTKIAQHANKTPLQATDLYPNATASDAALSLQDATVFTLSVTYTPPGGTPAVLQRQASVGVNYPGPSIGTFTISPPWVPPGQTTPVPVTLQWQTQQGAGEGPVGFALDPPLSAAEVAANAGNNFFNTPHTPDGQGTFNFLQGHRVTLTVVGKAGTNPATQTINFLSFQVLPRLTADVDIPDEIAFTRDGRYGMMINIPNDSGPALVVIDRHGGPPAQWTATGLFPDGVLSGVVVTPDDRSIIAADPKTLYVITIDPTTSPANWTIAKLFALTLAMFDEVAISPDGKYLFLGGMRGLFVIDMGPGLPHSQWIPVSIMQGLVQQLLTTPDGRYLLGSRTSADGQTTDMIVVQIAEGTRPQTWKISSLAFSNAVSTGVTPDSRYVFVTRSGEGTVAAIDTTASTDPAQWTLATIVAGNGNGQVAAAVGTPDNQFVFFARSADVHEQNAAFGMARIVPNENPSTWPNAVFGSPSPFIETYYLAGVTPDGRYLLVQYGQDTLIPLAVTPPLDGKPGRTESC